MADVSCINKAKALCEWSREVRDASRAARERAREVLNYIQEKEDERAVARRVRAASRSEADEVPVATER
jgi:hypothetical protein